METITNTLATITNVSEFLDWVNSNSDIIKEIKDREQEYLDMHTEYNIQDEYDLDEWFDNQFDELRTLYGFKISNIDTLDQDREELEQEFDNKNIDAYDYRYELEQLNIAEECSDEIVSFKRTIKDNKLYSKEVIKEFFKHKYLQATKNISVFFRGHADIRWKLLPSIFRDKYLNYESMVYKQALRDRPNEFTSPNILDNLVHMQHHGLPTRLLDITSNPLVALYFACDTSNTLSKIAGRVFLFIEKSFYNPEHSKLFSNFVLLPDENSHTFYSLALAQTVVDLLPIDKDKLVPKILLEDKTLYKPSKNNARLIAQSGEFYIYGHSILKREDRFSEVIKKVPIEGCATEIELPVFSKNNYINSEEPISVFISAEHKISILKELDQLNINQSSLFPDLDNYCSYIKSKYK